MEYGSCIHWLWPTVAQFGLMGEPYDFNICTIYGRIAWLPENCPIANAVKRIMNGFIVRRRSNSCNFSRMVGLGWGHFCWDLIHALQETEYSLYRLISSNSTLTALAETQPRSHCKDFRASASRFFDKSQSGVSGIWKNLNVTFHTSINK